MGDSVRNETGAQGIHAPVTVIALLMGIETLRDNQMKMVFWSGHREKLRTQDWIFLRNFSESDFQFFSGKIPRKKKNLRDIHFLLAVGRPFAPDPVLRLSPERPALSQKFSRGTPISLADDGVGQQPPAGESGSTPPVMKAEIL